MATGSTPMATRWLSCRARGCPWRPGSALRAAAVLFVVVGCVTSVTRYYTPPPGAQRLTPQELRTQLQLLLGVECPRLLAGKPSVAGGAELSLALAADSSVSRATITRTSGDSRVDDIIGGLAAELTLRRRADSATVRAATDSVPPAVPEADTTAGAVAAAAGSRADRARAVVLYSCTPSAAVATVTIGGA